MNKLWESRERGGDVEIIVNGEITSAHWCVLKEVAFFQRLTQVDKPTQLTIEDNSISLQSIVEAMKYVYYDYCFTDGQNPAEFLCFARFLKERSLAHNAFTLAMQSITETNCVEYFKIGRAYQLAPLTQKAWKKAIDNQWISQIEQMLAYKLDLNAPLTNEQQTALHISLDRGSPTLAKVLINAGAKVNASDQKGTTPLVLAAWDGHRHLSDLLLSSGADVDSRDQWGQTALHKACGRGLNDVAELLLQHGANANLRSKEGCTPLHMAAIGGHEDTVLILLRHGAKWVDVSVEWQWTALHMAAMRGQIQLVKLLLQLDTKQAMCEERECLTPLHTAVKFGYSNIVRTLIDHGVSINSLDYEGRTPLHYAAKAGYVEAIEMLVKGGADLYKQDNYRMTCLHLAASFNHNNAVSLLVRYQNCPTNVLDKRGLTALHYAAENRNTSMVRQLLRAGAVPTALSNDGKIARNLRGKKKHLDTLRFLIMCRS